MTFVNTSSVKPLFLSKIIAVLHDYNKQIGDDYMHDFGVSKADAVCMKFSFKMLCNVSGVHVFVQLIKYKAMHTETAAVLLRLPWLPSITVFW